MKLKDSSSLIGTSPEDVRDDISLGGGECRAHAPLI